MSDRDVWQARHAARPARGDPSPFVAEHVTHLAAGARGARALDVACGAGRHAALLAAHRFRTVALDAASEACRRVAREIPGVETVVADAAALPFRPSSFSVVVQTLFLDRPVVPRLLELLVPGGVLLVETFLRAQHEETGHPRLEFCLSPGELEHLCTTTSVPVRVLALREGRTSRGGQPVHLASIAVARSN